jgi:hypothetical protein
MADQRWQASKSPSWDEKVFAGKSLAQSIRKPKKSDKPEKNRRQQEG